MIIVIYKLKLPIAKMQKEPSSQYIKNEHTMDYPAIGQNLLPNNAPKRYNQYATKSADFSNIQVSAKS